MMLTTLRQAPPDPLLALIDAFRADPRPGKLDLGVGVYRDENGRTPVMRAVKAAERRLVEQQDTKAYVGASGDVEFVERVGGLVFGASPPAQVAGVQTPGGTAALRLAADLLARGGASRVFLPVPAWPNHEAILATAGLQVHPVEAFDAVSQCIRFDSLMEALSKGAPGDVVLLQAACHNPTGVDYTACQWKQLGHLIVERELIPLLDAAYLGLGQGLDEDAWGIRAIVRSSPLSLVAVSCSKSFGLYRERTGALFAYVNEAGLRGALISNALSIARANYSMPPDHGAAVVRLILEDPELARDWCAELGQMRARIQRLRLAIAAESRAGAIDLSSLGAQHGMFSQLPVPTAAMTALRRDRGIYLAVGGRMNVAGLSENDTRRFAEALAAACPA